MGENICNIHSKQRVTKNLCLLQIIKKKTSNSMKSEKVKWIGNSQKNYYSQKLFDHLRN